MSPAYAEPDIVLVDMHLKIHIYCFHKCIGIKLFRNIADVHLKQTFFFFFFFLLKLAFLILKSVKYICPTLGFVFSIKYST